jgi:hypothetical protein
MESITYPVSSCQPIPKCLFQHRIAPPDYHSKGDADDTVSERMHACVQTAEDYGHGVYQEDGA